MRNEIRDELKEIAASLANIGNENCYRVPDNYFEDVAGEVMSKIQLPFTQLPLTPPAPDYFDGLAGTILNKIKSNGTIVEANNEVTSELTELSPLVAGIKKENVYTVPADYFANFKVNVPATAEKTKVVAMRPTTHWARYAAAAVIVGVIAISGMFLLKNDTAINDTAVTITKYIPSLSSVSDNAIASYLKESPANMDIVLPVYDDSKINAGSLTEQLLQDVSDSDIQEYLQENQQPGEKDIKGI
ncbi:hypothetical protein FC093_03885 [Ilyomonas limi]|uniref:Uncharacterized protein n=1 Tax=Ilyomonas limi TaxID=2575867 RepID=A0A4U3L6I5_9BACT|nr:hypothetical protein [Ilyomonas limi]TKK70845.1 hypothetical protein FC093_03885 [Ilyomonas limi]